MYHSIGDETFDPWSVRVAPKHFEEHLEVIKKIAYPISMTELSRRLRENDLPKNAVAITFDDGYANNYELARPILNRHDYPGTIFVSSEYVREGKAYWWDGLADALLREGVLPEELRLTAGDKEYYWDLNGARSYTEAQYAEDKKTRPWQSTPGTRYGFFFQVWEAVHLAKPEIQHDLMCQILDWAGIESHALDDPYRPMTVEELATIEEDSQVEIGGHTKNHVNLASQSVEDQWKEIRESKEHLEEILGHSVSGFAYPYGKYSSETVEIVGHAGFDYACTVHPESVWQDSKPLLIPRWEVTDCDGEAFERQLKGWLEQ